MVDGGAGGSADSGRPDPDRHNVDGHNGPSAVAAVQWDDSVAEAAIGDPVVVRSHNGFDSGLAGVVVGASGGSRRVHLANGRLVVFTVGQLAPVPPPPEDEFA